MGIGYWILDVGRFRFDEIEANRRNSQLSTGPRSPEGKAVSRFNALKSGINAKAEVIRGEDAAELANIADNDYL